MSKITTVDDIKRRLRQKAGAVSEVLSGPAGKALMKALEEEFYDGEIADPSNTNQTFYNLGRRDVVVYLKQLQKFSEREEYGTGTT